MDSVPAPDTSRQTSTASRFYNVQEVGMLMGVPASTVYDLARQNRLGGMVRIGRHIRFDKAKFEAWLEAGGEAAQRVV